MVFHSLDRTNTHDQLHTIKEIKKFYVIQQPSHCGPACLAMALNIFGCPAEQDLIGKLAKTVVPATGRYGGTKPEELIQAAGKITQGKVSGTWISAQWISNLKHEIKEWLNDEGLVIVDFKKSYLFPSAKKAHYCLCMGIHDDNLLLVDPSRLTGGVYLVNYRRVRAGIDTYSEFLGGKRGYLVLAKKGTRAYFRIKNSLIYAEPALLHEINDAIFGQLEKMRQHAIQIGEMLPPQVKNYLKTFYQKEKVTRIWKPN